LKTNPQPIIVAIYLSLSLSHALSLSHLLPNL
jgi:hypothetical protein